MKGTEMSTVLSLLLRLSPALLLCIFLQASTIHGQDASVEAAYVSHNDLVDGNLRIPGIPEHPAGILVQDIRAHQLNLLNNNPPVPNSIEGMLIFRYSSPAPLYLTIGAERLGVGFTFVSQNLYAEAAPTLAVVGIRFNLQQLGINNGTPWPPTTQLRIYFHYGSAPTPSPPPMFMQYDLPVTPLNDEGSNAYGDPTGSEPMIDNPTPPPNLNSPINHMSHYGCTVPNIDLDSQTNPGVPGGYAGDRNACGPAAASNSLKWMEAAFPGITIPFSHRALIDSLSRYMGRQPNGGVNIQSFIRGKIDFIERHELPIRVKFQAQGVSGNVVSSSGNTLARNDNSGSLPTWQFLKQEMADSEDVELFYKWFDGTDWRGHVVTVTGAYETQSGKRYIGLKHDIKQGDTGGTVQEFPEITVDQHGRMILHRHGRPRYVAHVVSESPGPPFTTTGVGEDSGIIRTFLLAQNYPNPFNPSTTIRFNVGEISRTTLKVYDMLGQEVATLVDDIRSPGSHAVEFTPPSGLASGVYYYRLVAGTSVRTRTMLFMK